VKDNDGQESNPDTANLRILNALPTATLTGVPSGSIPPSTVFTVAFGGHDNDENNKNIVAGELSLDGAILANITPGGTYDITAPSSEGNYQIMYKVQDDEGTWSLPATETLTVSSGVTYTITASTGNGGQISPSGTTQVNLGASQTYSITPNAGYHISDVLVDGSSVGAVTSYSFTNVTADHTIAATFAIDIYSITASAGNGGQISPSGTKQVDSGGSLTYSISPNAGYHISDVLVDGSSVGAVTSYTFTNVTADHTIAATFTESEPYHPADTDSDYVISMLEILGYIDQWAVGNVSMLEVLEGIDLWAAGHYYWDPVDEKFKPGEP